MDPFKSSRFRFLDSQPFSFECKYTDIVLPSSNVDQVVVKTNGDLFALPINGPTGQLYVRPVKGSERFTHKAPRLNCHRYAVSTFAFDPFDSSLLMTGAEDGEIRMWKIPKEGIVSNENDPVLTLEGHRRKILNMEYNPVASDVLATGSSDGSCKIWSISSKRELMSIELQGSQLQEMKWDYTGSLLCTGTKSREYHIWDPRTVNVVTNWVGHGSPRRSYMTWLGDSYYLVTTGYSKQSNREVMLRDIRNINQVVYTITADNSPGPFIPFYNPCCHILWYSGRGDAKLNGIDVDDVTMWTNREGGNSITINMKSSVKSLAILPQSLLDIKRNEVDKFLEINMDCGVDGFDVILPHQAGAAITEIYGKLPVASPAITTKDWLQGAIEKPKTKDVSSPYSPSKALVSGRHQSEGSSMKFIKQADMKSFIQDSRQKSFSREELNSFNQGLSALAETLGSTDTIKSTDSNSSLTRSLNVTTLFRGSANNTRNDKNSIASVRTTNGVSRRTSIFKAPMTSQSTLRKGTAVAQLEQSKNRLCLNLNRQKKETIPAPKETPRSVSPQTNPSRGYRVSDITGMDRPAPAKQIEKSATLGRLPERPQPPPPSMKGNDRLPTSGVSPTGVTLGELKRNQGNSGNLPSLPSYPASRLPTVSPTPSSQISTSTSVTPVSSRGPSLENLNLRQGASSKSSVVIQETRNSWNRSSSEHDKDIARLQSRLDSIENTLSKYEELNRKLDILLSKIDSLNGSNNEEIKESLSIIRQRLGC